MITYISDGSIFASTAVALVNPVNTVGSMGKGLAKEFKERYPTNYLAYKVACMKKLVKIGEMLIGYAGDYKRYIINFPTKIRWQDPSTYDYIATGLADLVRVIETNQIDSIAIPALGCGEGGLDWKPVKALLEQHLDKLTCDITIYLPKNK